MIKRLNMNHVIPARRLTCLVLLLTVVTFACRKKYAYEYVDGTPGDGAAVPSVTVDTSLKTVDASKYGQARVFPGLACATEPRLNNYQVAMDFNYNYVGDDLRISVPPQPQFSTGLYAAPGELVIVDVPQGIYSLAIQVGAWTDNLSSIQSPARDPIIYSRTQLAPGRNYIRNLYGGPVYINAATPIAEPVNLVFTNVLKSPDFVLGVTSNAEWQASIQSSCVPWLELRSKNIIFTLPREYCLTKPIADPTALMTEWDNAINLDYYQWEKLSANPADPIDKAPFLPWRVVMDIKPVAGYGHSGYPVVTYNDYRWFDEFTNINKIRGGGCWGTFHEIGHNNQQTKYWSWSSLGETSNNLFIFKVAKRQSATYPSAWPPTIEQPSLTTAFPSALAFAADTARIKNFDGTDTRIDNPFSRITPFIQLFDKVPTGSTYDGWKLMGELYSNARKAQRISLNDQDKRDFLYETVCNYTGLDWRTFFNRWGIQVSNISLNKMINYPLMTRDIWTYNPLTRTGGTTQADQRVNWTITASSYSTSEGTNGYPARAIDGLTTTYWHSNYGTGVGATAPPHSLTIDMGRPTSVSGFQFALRESGTTVTTAIKWMKVEYSTDGVNYTFLPNFTPANTPKAGYGISLLQQKGLQNFTITGGPLTFRYFRVSIPTASDNASGNNSALSEINIF